MGVQDTRESRAGSAQKLRPGDPEADVLREKAPTQQPLQAPGQVAGGLRIQQLLPPEQLSLPAQQQQLQHTTARSLTLADLNEITTTPQITYVPSNSGRAQLTRAVFAQFY